jgi:hypothetical protein
VSAVLFFHLIDEQNLNVTSTSGGWQSGLEYPNGTHKPSFAAVQQAISAGCNGSPSSWSPSGGAVGPTGNPVKPLVHASHGRHLARRCRHHCHH